MPEPIPRNLIEGARTGRPDEIERLIEAVWPDAYRLARAVLGTASGAEDVAQETCVLVYRNITSLRNASAFRVWLYRIVMREALQFKRFQSQNDDPLEPAIQRNDPEESIDLWRALNSLPQPLRSVVLLRYFEDLTSREIASVLRIPDGTVRFRLMIAKKRLHRLLDVIATVASKEVRTNAV